MCWLTEVRFVPTIWFCTFFNLLYPLYGFAFTIWFCTYFNQAILYRLSVATFMAPTYMRCKICSISSQKKDMLKIEHFLFPTGPWWSMRSSSVFLVLVLKVEGSSPYSSISISRYSEAPNTGRPVWQTRRFYVRIADFRFWMSEVYSMCLVYEWVWNPDIYVRILNVRSIDVQNRKLVPNRFGTGLELVVWLEPIGTERPITGCWKWNEPDVR